MSLREVVSLREADSSLLLRLMATLLLALQDDYFALATSLLAQQDLT